MAWSFGDSFDLYATQADMANGYWDTATGGSMTFVAGRFGVGQALRFATGTFNLTRSSGVNDAVHHFVVSFQQAAAISGTTLGGYLQLLDGATAQCSIVFRSDGAILLTSGGPAGTVLATYTGAFPVTATWYAFEFEVVINSATGSFSVRKNGNSVNDFTLGSLNTRGGTANNYANKLTVGMQVAVNAQQIDDLFWRSDASSVAWLGDIRCYARMPASDQSVTFSRSPVSPVTLPPFTTFLTTGSLGVGVARYAGFISPGGSLASVVVTLLAGYTGNLKCAVFGCTSGALGTGVGAILGTATASIANPVTGANTFTFSPAIAIPVGTLFYVGIDSDASSGASSISSANASPYNTYAATSNTAYASFPAAAPTLAITLGPNLNIGPVFTSVPNCSAVNEPQEDGLTSYVYDSNPGDADFYGVGSIASTPATVIATTTRGYMQKSDAGTRTAAVQLKSGATTVASPTLTLTTSGWQWAWRMDTLDPNTSLPWTAAAVNNAQIGPKTIA